MRGSLIVPALCALSCSGASSARAAGEGSYLPLAVGNRWELSSAALGQSMTFEVAAARDGVFEVRWRNPWIKAQFGFRPEGQRIILDRIDLGAGPAAVPGNAVQFDFSAGKGAKWTNPLGSFEVTDAGFTLSTPAGPVPRCITIRARDRKGSDAFWTFSPGIGFVQYGQGSGAFLLSSYTVGGAKTPAPTTQSKGEPPQASSDPKNGAGKKDSGHALIALDANPTAVEGYSGEAVSKRFRMSLNAGVNFLYISPKWNELESSPGQYRFQDLDRKLQLAADGKLPVLLNIRVIDTNNRAMPGWLSRASFSSPAVIDALNALLAAVGARAAGKVRWVTVGNEVDAYLDSHRSEIGDYAKMIRAISPGARRAFPGSALTVNFTFGAAGKMQSTYREIASCLDIASFTYYPLNADFTMRDPGVVFDDMDLLLRAAGDRRLILQEVGYPSAPSINSSEEKQAQFVRNMMQAIRRNPRVAAANFVWMSDLPDSVVNDFARYYRLAHVSNFRAYIATLGYFDKAGRPKQAWAAFQDAGK